MHEHLPIDLGPARGQQLVSAKAGLGDNGIGRFLDRGQLLVEDIVRPSALDAQTLVRLLALEVGRLVRIQRSVARMNRLIGDLVDVASIEAGALAVKCQLSDSEQVVTEAIETFQLQAAATGVSLASEFVPGSSIAEFDPARILQVLANLIGNAIKFTPAGGCVVVRVERGEDELRFAVRDTGVGIPAEHLDAIFERFRQINADDRRGGGGWGSTSRSASCVGTAGASGQRAHQAGGAHFGSRSRSLAPSA